MNARRLRQLRKRHSHLAISLTPLIDVALTLLVIFIVATPMMHRSIKVDLPQGNVDEVKDAAKAQELVVHIDTKGTLYLNGDRKSKNELIQALQYRARSKQKSEMVIVKADETIPYGTVIELVDMIKHVGGISYVALATQKPRKK